MPKESVLLHICCAPDATTAIKDLERHFHVIGFFDNSNIFPLSEYKKRLRAAERLCNIWKTELIVPEYDPDSWEKQMRGLEKIPENGARCRKCIYLNLRRTAVYAADNGIENFTTSLSTSPKKDVGWILKSGVHVSKEFDVNFTDTVFRKKNGYLRSVFYTRLLELYRQEYCGCRYSIGRRAY